MVFFFFSHTNFLYIDLLIIILRASVNISLKSIKEISWLFMMRLRKQNFLCHKMMKLKLDCNIIIIRDQIMKTTTYSITYLH